MADKTTTLDINTTSPEILEIIKKWAVEEKFLIYEEDEKRIIYHKNIRLTTAWFLIKKEDEKTKIETWFAPKGLKPETTGNMWKGYKSPVPGDFVVGPDAIYKKLYHSLIKALESKLDSTTQIDKASLGQPKIKKESFVNVFIFLGALNILTGLLGIFNTYNSFSNLYITKDNQSTLTAGAIFDLVMGIVYIGIARLLKKGKLLAIWLYSFTIVATVINGIIIGAKFPYFTIIFSAFTILLLWELKKSGELS